MQMGVKREVGGRVIDGGKFTDNLFKFGSLFHLSYCVVLYFNLILILLFVLLESEEGEEI
jgi:hypothetical protein